MFWFAGHSESAFDSPSPFCEQMQQRLGSSEPGWPQNPERCPLLRQKAGQSLFGAQREQSFLPTACRHMPHDAPASHFASTYPDPGGTTHPYRLPDVVPP